MFIIAKKGCEEVLEEKLSMNDAVVSHIRTRKNSIHFTFFWEKENKTYNYQILKSKESEFMHDYNPADETCPFCIGAFHDDCLTLNDTQRTLLAEKLAEKNLKSLFYF